MTPYNEREVLKLLQEESTQRKGFELIVAQYSEQLYWQIRRMVLSHEDANDLLQNTFIKAWTNIDYFRAEAKLSTWLYRIALNECLTFLNRQRATTTVAIDDPEAAIVQKLESDPYYSGDQVQMLLQKALLTLPEKQRMVFNLKSILNVYGTGPRIQRLVPGVTVLDGCIYIVGFVSGKGEITQMGKIFRLVYGAHKDTIVSRETLAAIQRDLQESGIKADISPDINRDTFVKWSFISPWPLPEPTTTCLWAKCRSPAKYATPSSGFRRKARPWDGNWASGSRKIS